MRIYRRKYRDDEGKLRRSRKWTADYRDHRGRRVRESLDTTNETAAKMIGAERLRAAELRRAGLDTFEPTRRASLEQLVREYCTDLERQAKDPKHVRVTRARCLALVAGVASIEDLTAERIGKRLGALAGELPLVPRTQNAYRVALSGFFAWLGASGRWGSNPAEAVKPAEVAGNQEDRKALTIEQLTALVGEPTPIHRATVYLVAGLTGLRRGELAEIREQDLDLERGTLRVREAQTKNAQAELIPLAGWAVELLRRYLLAVPPERVVQLRGRPLGPRGAWLFLAVPTVATLRADLARAGVALELGQGERFDLHALRTTFCTLLARADVTLQLAQRLMRHSDPRLTANIYTRLVLHDGAGAVARLKPVPRTVPPASGADRSASG